jgi:hypothetical protein
MGERPSRAPKYPQADVVPNARLRLRGKRVPES